MNPTTRLKLMSVIDEAFSTAKSDMMHWLIREDNLLRQNGIMPRMKEEIIPVLKKAVEIKRKEYINKLTTKIDEWAADKSDIQILKNLHLLDLKIKSHYLPKFYDSFKTSFETKFAVAEQTRKDRERKSRLMGGYRTNCWSCGAQLWSGNCERDGGYGLICWSCGKSLRGFSRE